MYQLLGDKVVDVQELIGQFEKNGITVSENVTKATKREDAVGLRIKVPLSETGISDRVYDEDAMEEYMKKIQDIYTEKIKGFLDESFAFSLYAYTYDEVSDSIMLNFTMMDKSTSRRKLPDIAKRLFDV